MIKYKQPILEIELNQFQLNCLYTHYSSFDQFGNALSANPDISFETRMDEEKTKYKCLSSLHVLTINDLVLDHIRIYTHLTEVE